MALSAQFVDRIFVRLAARYGASWFRMWDGIPMEAVKADWAETLAGLNDSPDAIRYALDNLPVDWPPNSAQFVALCINKPEPAPIALPAPRADSEVVRAVMDAVNVQPVNPRAWAHELRRRELACERLTAAQRSMWREALREPETSEAA